MRDSERVVRSTLRCFEGACESLQHKRRANEPCAVPRCRACKGVVAKGATRIVTLAVVCERPRRVTTFVRHAECADVAFAAHVRRAHGHDVPVVGGVDSEVADMVRANLWRLGASSPLNKTPA